MTSLSYRGPPLPGVHAPAQLSPHCRTSSPTEGGLHLTQLLVLLGTRPDESTISDHHDISGPERGGTSNAQHCARDIRGVARAGPKMDNAPRLLAGFLLISLSLAVYFTPTLVAFGRDHYNRGAIFVLNLLLGWTLFGWVAALVWACMNPGTATADDRAPCPYCCEPIIATARLCRFCGRELAADWSRPLPRRRA